FFRLLPARAMVASPYHAQAQPSEVASRHAARGAAGIVSRTAPDVAARNGATVGRASPRAGAAVASETACRFGGKRARRKACACKSTGREDSNRGVGPGSGIQQEDTRRTAARVAVAGGGA